MHLSVFQHETESTKCLKQGHLEDENALRDVGMSLEEVVSWRLRSILHPTAALRRSLRDVYSGEARFLTTTEKNFKTSPHEAELKFSRT